jgi:hypothetical protein
VIAHYAIRFLMHEAAQQANLDPDQLSFVHAVQVISEAIPEFQMTAPDQLDQLYHRLLHDIATGRLPARRLRSNPRVVKRKMSKFYLKRPEQTHPLQPTQPSFREAVKIIPLISEDTDHVNAFVEAMGKPVFSMTPNVI